MNWPQGCGTLVSNGKATLLELETHYSVRDVFLMLEILAVDLFNQKLISKGAADVG